MDFDAVGPIELLILQSTSFCNIDCSYCYLPDRGLVHRMSLSVFEKVLRNVAGSGLLSRQPVLQWHAGEPLTVPVSWYREASALLRSIDLKGSRFVQSFQTNGMLIDDRWCAFFKEEEARIGISLDGPRFLHDRNRRTRRGLGTFDAVLRGVEVLARHQIDFSVISVLTGESLDFPDEIYAFFCEIGARTAGFNIEESSGINTSKTLEESGIRDRLTAFMRRIHELQKDGRLAVREITNVREVMAGFSSPHHTGVLKNPNVRPLSILTVGYDGSSATFSPELLGSRSVRYGDFDLGNLAEEPVRDLLASRLFLRAEEDIRAGVDLCRRTCRYFPYCGGGSPSNKLTETGTFTSAETKYCTTQIQPVIDVVLADYEREIGLARS